MMKWLVDSQNHSSDTPYKKNRKFLPKRSELVSRKSSFTVTFERLFHDFESWCEQMKFINRMHMDAVVTKYIEQLLYVPYN